MKKGRWIPYAILLTLIALGGLATCVVRGQPDAPPAETRRIVGEPLPDVRVTSLSGGEPHLLSEEIVGVTVINVFASWCAPCRAENAVLLGLQAEGVRIVGLAYRDEPAATRAFLDSLGDPFFRVVTDSQGEADAALGFNAQIPMTVVVAADGEVLMVHAGPLVGADGEAALEEIRRLAGPR